MGEGSLVLDLASSFSSPSMDSSSSSSSISACSAHHRPACRAKTPVKATLQMRWEDAKLSIGSRRVCGNGGRGLGIEFDNVERADGTEDTKGRGRDVKFAKMSTMGQVGDMNIRVKQGSTIACKKQIKRYVLGSTEYEYTTTAVPYKTVIRVH